MKAFSLIEGKVAPTLVRFALPFMLSNALQVVYSLVDMLVVGQVLGTNAVSGVTNGSTVVMFMPMVGLGFSNGGQVLISQALGAKKRKEMNDVIGTLFGFVSIVSLIMSALIILFRHGILTVMNIPAESYDMAMDYLVICAFGLLFTAGYNMVSAVLRGMGDAKRPFMFIGIDSNFHRYLDGIPGRL